MSIRAALIGCGVISDIYLTNFTGRFRSVDIVCVCDTNPQAAERVAGTYHVAVRTLQDCLNDPDIRLVINLTPPLAHHSVIRQAILAGKHVYTEKPMATTLEEAQELCALAAEHHVLLGSAPDTFLGAAAQTARQALDSGFIGRVTSCVAFLNRDGGWMAEKYPLYSAGWRRHRYGCRHLLHDDARQPAWLRSRGVWFLGYLGTRPASLFSGADRLWAGIPL